LSGSGSKRRLATELRAYLKRGRSGGSGREGSGAGRVMPPSPQIQFQYLAQNPTAKQNNNKKQLHNRHPPNHIIPHFTKCGYMNPPGEPTCGSPTHTRLSARSSCGCRLVLTTWHRCSTLAHPEPSVEEGVRYQPRVAQPTFLFKRAVAVHGAKKLRIGF
jgi:hypothetical protein